jgi:hypothetical protein
MAAIRRREYRLYGLRTSRGGFSAMVCEVLQCPMTYSDIFDVAMVFACTDSVYEMFSVLNSVDILRDTRGLAMMDFLTEGFQCNGRLLWLRLQYRLYLLGHGH